MSCNSNLVLDTLSNPGLPMSLCLCRMAFRGINRCLRSLENCRSRLLGSATSQGDSDLQCASEDSHDAESIPDSALSNNWCDHDTSRLQPSFLCQSRSWRGRLRCKSVPHSRQCPPIYMPPDPPRCLEAFHLLGRFRDIAVV